MVNRLFKPTGELTDPQQVILVTAAVFNGEFSIDWLQEITREKASTILQALNHAEKYHWIKHSAHGLYTFINKKQHQKLYDTLTPSNKQQLHEQAVQILLQELPEVSDENRELANHLLKIDNSLEGCRRLIDWGNYYRKKYQMKEAFRFYEKAMKDIIPIREGTADRLFIETAIQFMKVSTPADIRRIRPVINSAMKRAEIMGDITNLALLRMSLAMKEWMLSHFSRALRLFNLGWSVAQAVEDPIYRRSANVFRIFFLYWHGQLQKVVSDYEKYAPAIEETPESEYSLISQVVMGACLSHLGQVSQGLGMMDAMRKHCLDVGNTNMASHATSIMGLISIERNRFQEALEYHKTALGLAIKGHSQWIHIWSLLGLAYSYFKLGEVKNSVNALKEFSKLSLRFQFLLRPMPMIMDLCWEMELGNYPRVKGLRLDNEIRQSIKTKNVFLQGIAYYYKALSVLRTDGKETEGIKYLKKSIEFHEKSGQTIQLTKSKLELARVYRKKGQKKKSEALAGDSVNYLYAINKSMVPDDFRFMVNHRQENEELLKEILKLGQEMATFRNYQDLTRHVISAVNRLTGAERGAIFLIEPATENLKLEAAKNITKETIHSKSFGQSMSLIHQTLKNEKGGIIHSDTVNNAILAVEGSICSMICVPMVLRNKVIGVLYHDNQIYKSTFQTSDLETLNYFSTQAAIALDNAKAYQSLQNQYQKEKEEKQYLEKQYLEDLNFEEIIGVSSGIKKVFSNIESVAETDTAVLITGETGVGKELVARAIHKHSRRKDAPFIRVNCSALSESLIASELFGHEKGAFTGATHKRTGRFELADGGTLFLDEIGDIPISVQVQLLRIIQTKEFERVGGQTTLQSDFRLMAATNRDLAQDVQKGDFRMDLFYRLNVFPIHVPPLRDRKKDISLLAYHFLKIYAKKLNKTIKQISTEEMETLVDYCWPGNVRELENCIERGVILSDHSKFRLPPTNIQPTASPNETVVLSHQDAERAHIMSILKKTSGKISGKKGAAILLDMHPNTLRYRMKKLGVNIQRNPNQGE